MLCVQSGHMLLIASFKNIVNIIVSMGHTVNLNFFLQLLFREFSIFKLFTRSFATKCL